jgi:uncharacterized protein
VKLVVREPESQALAEFLGDWPQQVSSVVSDIEVHRAAARAPNAEKAIARTDALLAELTLVALTPTVVDVARTAPPPTLRTIDAIHLASALSLDADLGVLVAYDERLIAAGQRAGARLASPG